MSITKELGTGESVQTADLKEWGPWTDSKQTNCHCGLQFLTWPLGEGDSKATENCRLKCQQFPALSLNQTWGVEVSVKWLIEGPVSPAAVLWVLGLGRGSDQQTPTNGDYRLGESPGRAPLPTVPM